MISARLPGSSIPASARAVRGRWVPQPGPFAEPLCFVELEERARELAEGLRLLTPEQARENIAEMTAANWDPSIVRRAEYLAGLADE